MHLKSYASLTEARHELSSYFTMYDRHRLYQSRNDPIARPTTCTSGHARPQKGGLRRATLQHGLSSPFAHRLGRTATDDPLGRPSTRAWTTLHRGSSPYFSGALFKEVKPRLSASLAMYVPIQRVEFAASAAAVGVVSTLVALFLTVAFSLAAYLAALTVLWRLSGFVDSPELIVGTWIDNSVRRAMRGPANGSGQ
ncbi:hypothetical protein FBR04_00165 [Betaproteobacteria bacterium PRO7]|nr:hypothetical protein [Betaproteobacteria bacterium PRO7]